MRGFKPVLLFIFFVSGAAGLVYEVTWTRMLTLVFGSTVYATSTVLTAFMGGLALGSFYLSKKLERFEKPLITYAGLEIGIGVFALLFPLILKSLASVYVSLHRTLDVSFYAISLIRFALAFLVLLVPTTLMGATLPIISRGAVSKLESVGWDVGGLYSVNTFGAVCGTVATGFVLIRALGVRETLILAAFLNFGAAVGAALLQRGLPPLRVSTHRDEKAEVRPSSARRLVLWAVGISGFCALSYEVLWTRVLVFFLGSTTYAFSTMLASFLLGIAVGSFVFSKAADKTPKPLLPLGLLQVGIAVSAILLLPLFGEIYSIGALFKRPTWFNFIMGKFTPALSMMFVPTFMMGAVFPLAVKAFVSELPHLSGQVGTVYASNTLGSILGSFTSGFVLIPLLGIQRGVLAIALVNGLLGIWLIRKEGVRPKQLAPALIVLLGLEGIFIPVSHKPIVLKSAIFRYQHPNAKLLFYEEGVDATVTVLEDEDGTRSLYVDANRAAEDSRWDSPSHRVIAHLPLLLHPNPRRALVVGVGMGLTTYSVTQHGVEVDAVEISPGVIKAAERFFTHVNKNVFKSPLVHLFIEDGRNFILTTDRKYDMISTGIIHPLVSSGSSNIYSKDFYELCKRILTENGVMCQWVPLHRLPLDQFKMVIRTFMEVFPHTTLWYKFTPDFVILIGTRKPLRIDFKDFVKRASAPGVREGLEHDDLDAYSLLDSFMMDEEALRRFVGEGEIHTDDHPRLEFFGPGLMETTAENLIAMKPFRRSVIPYLVNYGDTPEERREVEDKLSRYFKATQLLIDAQIAYAKGQFERAAQLAYKAWRMNPLDGTIRFNMEVAREIALSNIDAQLEGIAAELRRRVRENPDDLDSYLKLGAIYQKLNRLDDAISAYKRAKQLDPENLQIRLALGTLYEARGDLDRAIAEYEEALRISDMPFIHGALATLYQKKGRIDEAISEIKKVLKAEPNLALAHSILGSLYAEKGEIGKAEKELLKAIELDPTLIAPRVNLASIYSDRGDLGKAEEVLREAMEVDPNVYEVRLDLAKVLMRQGKLREALEHARIAHALNKTEEAAKLIGEIERAMRRGGASPGSP